MAAFTAVRGSRALRVAPAIALVLLLIAVPSLAAEYKVYILALAGTLLLPAAGLNLLKGYAGPISVGHGALMAVGGYAAALLMVDAGVSLWVAAPVAIVLTGLVGAVVALPSFRISAWYFALLTLTLGMAIQRLIGEMSWLTYGNAGVTGIPLPSLFGTTFTTIELYYLVLVVNVLGFLLLRNLVTSRTGRAMQAIRDAPPVARAVGISIGWTTVNAFVISAAYAGIGGALFAVLKMVITPNDFDVHLSITLLIYVVLGGLGQMWGPVVGIAVFFWLPQMFPALNEWRTLALGVVVLAITALTPDGVVGAIAALRSRVAHRRRREAPAAPGSADAAVTAGTGQPPAWSREPAPLHVDGVTKRFAGVLALDEVSIDAPAGEIHGIVGSNGSGKTTLLNVISGVYPTDGGSIQLGFQRISGRPAHWVARAGVGRTFQTPTMLQRLSVLDNVLLGAHTRAHSPAVTEVLRTIGARREDRRLRTEAETWLHFVGIAAHTREQAAVLPHGQQRLLEIARAMLLEPKLLLLDEPAAGLSLQELEQLTETIDAIRQIGVTVLLVEHHLDMVAGIATSVTALDQGQVIAQGTPTDVFTSSAAREAYMGAPL